MIYLLEGQQNSGKRGPAGGFCNSDAAGTSAESTLLHLDQLQGFAARTFDHDGARIA